MASKARKAFSGGSGWLIVRLSHASGEIISFVTSQYERDLPVQRMRISHL
jgi:hypothetical protein